MFRNPRFITRGVQTDIQPEIQRFLWSLLDSMEGKMDYLQVFHLEPCGGKQHITHTQEQPLYHREYDIGFSVGGVPVVSKLFAIDDGDHSTLLLASEY